MSSEWPRGNRGSAGLAWSHELVIGATTDACEASSSDERARKKSSWIYDVLAVALDQAALHGLIERFNGEIKRRNEVVSFFPNKDAIACLIGAILLEQNDAWEV